jgi:hypothetical protein
LVRVIGFAGQPIEEQIRNAFERTAARKNPTGDCRRINAEQDTHDEWRDLNDTNKGCLTWTKPWTKLLCSLAG